MPARLLLLLLLSPLCVAAPLRLVVQEFAPYSFMGSDNQPTGAMVDMVKEACSYWPEGCQITLRPNLRARKELDLGEVDGMFPLAWSDARAKTLSYSVPLCKASWGIFAHVDEIDAPLTLARLGHARIGVTRGSFSETLLRQLDDTLHQQGIPPMQLELNVNDDYANLLKIERQGRYNLYFSNLDVALYRLNLSGASKIRLWQKSHEANYYIAFNRQRMSEAQLAAFNQILTRLEAQGNLLRHRVHWGLSSPLPDHRLHTLFPPGSQRPHAN
ncbi:MULTISPECIES: substrate-binding periplasmic protein [Aeromonas]|uniref:substrate-binding periplasmic protein n=1 Tax=Aeromonas TaxID=642 RepID=UPI0007EDD871|nr:MULTISPECIES: transporter substrate-binding domain-containing protein [Aeromonas]OBR40686.1 ABC transporter substrate-binding protein [Aeromonas dhakensis]QXA17291.1 transporter substrate-binding domain-containing protein [Aeromonas sp. FDAARGOS 1403]